MKVNTRLRVLRAERGISQMEIAKRAGLTQNRYWRIENGYADATPDEQHALATVFDIPAAEAFPEEDRATA